MGNKKAPLKGLLVAFSQSRSLVKPEQNLMALIFVFKWTTYNAAAFFDVFVWSWQASCCNCW